MLRLRKRFGQSTAEYAILIGVVIAAVIAMQSWVGRNIKAKIKDAAEKSGTTLGAGNYSLIFTTNQYEPGGSSYTETTRSGGGETTRRDVFGGEITRSASRETINRTGNIVSPGM